MIKTKIIAEIGINHNGDLDIVRKLINVAAVAACDYVKFQKRNPDVCVPESQKNIPKQTPWGDMTYLEYKHRIEFEKDDYDQIDSLCRQNKIKWFASVWDEGSVDFMSNYTNITKIPSAMIVDRDLCKRAREKNEKLLISTGMSVEEEIDECVDNCDPDVIFHTNSTYPCKCNELNLNYIKWLKEKYPDKEIGYSGHEYGLVTTYPTIALGATYIERHITLNRDMWGSDQAASVEPSGLIKLVKGIRDIESSMGDIGPRILFGSEKQKMQMLRP